MIRPPVRHPFFDHPGVVAMAHRGGAAEAPENSPAAFARAVGLGFRYVETDVRATRDRVLVISHDATLERTTGMSGAVADLTWREVSRARDAGGEPPMSLLEALERFPHLRLNLDLKSDDAVEPFLGLALEHPRVLERVCIGSFSDARLARVRAVLGDRVATSAGPREVARLAARRRGAPARVVPRSPMAAQVPERLGRVRLVDTAFVRRCHEHGLQVHVWTVDDAVAMNRLLDLGVDGIISDRPSLLREVLSRRGRWSATA